MRESASSLGWYQMSLMSTPNSSAENDEMLLVVASSAALQAAGLDMGLIDAVPCPPSSAGDVANAGTGLPPRIMIGRLRAAEESADDVQSQVVHLRHALKAIGQISQEGIAIAVEQLPPAVGNQDHDRFEHEYGVLTVEEMADRMKCSPEVVREREVAGDLFAALAPSRADGPRYPKFQLKEGLDKSLLKQIIQEYRDAGVSTTLLWSFLRSPQKIFAGFTPMEMMLGASPPAYTPLTPEEWTEAFLDVVAEELSRVR